MPIFDRVAGVWKKTAKEVEKEQAKIDLQAKVLELQTKLNEQEQRTDQMNVTLGDLLLGGL